MVVDKRNTFLVLSVVLSVAIFGGCVVEKPRVTGQVDVGSLKPLFSKYDLSLKTNLKEVSIYSLDGTEIASQGNVTPVASFSFQVPSGAAYFLKARTADGVNLWAITPVISNDTVQNISLNTTYEAALIVASLGKAPSSGKDDLKQKAAEALEWDVDRLVKTVKRVVNSAILKRVDYSPVTEVNIVTLRAFAGGLEPVRSLDSVLSEPELDYTPFIYAARYVSMRSSDPNNILLTEIDAKRWDYRVQGTSTLQKFPEIKTTNYPDGFEMKHASKESDPHITNGGTKLVFASNRHCVEDTSLCPYSYNSYQNIVFTFTFDAIYTIPLDAPADAQPTRLTPANKNFNAYNPMWSWDEEKIVFYAGPIRRPKWMDESWDVEGLIPEQKPDQIYVMNNDGTDVTQLTFDKDPQILNRQPAWSPDNKQIVYVSTRTGNEDLWIMNSDGSGNTQLTNNPGSNESDPKFSPDGRQIVFESDRDGDFEIFVMDRDGSNVKQLTYNNVNDGEAAWAHNGLDIVYRSESKSGKFKLVRLNTVTGKTVRDFGDFADATSYDKPVWAATNHILIPSKEAIEEGKATKEGYVTAEGGAARTATANPPVQGSFLIIKLPQKTTTGSSSGSSSDSWCSQPGRGCDQSAYVARVVGQAGMNYVSPSVD